VLDLTKEAAIPLAAACPLLPPGRNGRRVHFSTLWRWALKGVKSPTGEIVKLETLRLGSRLVTSREAVQRFALALSRHLAERPPAPAPRTPGARRRAAERADRELARLGI
jgi:hypothetical protein